MSYSEDIRKLSIAFVSSGGSKAEASRRFGVGVRTIFYWLQQGEKKSGKMPGPKTSRKFDRNDLIALVEDRPDIMLKELSDILGVAISTICHSLKVLGHTRKKNGTLQREKAL